MCGTEPQAPMGPESRVLLRVHGGVAWWPLGTVAPAQGVPWVPCKRAFSIQVCFQIAKSIHLRGSSKWSWKICPGS